MHQLVNCAYRDIHGISHLLERIALQAVELECTARAFRQPFKRFTDTLQLITTDGVSLRSRSLVGDAIQPRSVVTTALAAISTDMIERKVTHDAVQVRGWLGDRTLDSDKAQPRLLHNIFRTSATTDNGGRIVDKP